MKQKSPTDLMVIANENTSITLQDGGSYQIGDLPANSSIEAVAIGAHESVGFNVNGNENEENTVPYEHYWTPAVGTHVISVSLFNEDNCWGIKCDEKTITINITDNNTPTPSNLSIDAGADVTICDGQTQLQATVSGEASCPTGCDINNDQVIAKWNMDQCASFVGDGSNESYTEFGGTVNNLGCTSVNSTGFYRHAGKHSCTDDGDNNAPGDAVCLGMPTISNWQDNHPMALRFDISLAGGSQVAGITKITFKEFAPANYLWSQQGYDDNTGVNNYPTKYGIRILKNGVENSGTTNEVSYKWSTGETNATITADQAGTYQVTVTDCTGAQATDQVEVITSELSCQATVSQMLTSVLTNDATATASANGTNAPYSYNWSNGQTSATANNLSTGSYTVTVTDNNGCQCISNVTIDGHD